MHRVDVACMQVFYVDHVIQDHSSNTIYHDVLNLNIENVILTVVHDEKTNQFSMKKRIKLLCSKFINPTNVVSQQLFFGQSDLFYFLIYTSISQFPELQTRLDEFK